MSLENHTVLGVKFKVGAAPALIDYVSQQGGLVVVPSAPVLVSISEDASLREAVLGADMAITDSGLMVLMWRLLGHQKLERVSGLEYLKILLGRPENKLPGVIFFVMPGKSAMDRNLAWLQTQGFATTVADCYVAPIYGQGFIQDKTLLDLITERRPRHVIMCLGGGVQERVAYYLRKQLLFKPGLHCIGAAIGFLTGDQVRIPMWVDYLYLGWLWRIGSAPTKFFPRYWRATRLAVLLWKYGADAPPVRN